MGLWDRMKSRLGLGDDYDDEYDDDYYDPEDEEDDRSLYRGRAQKLYESDAAAVRPVVRQPDVERAREMAVGRGASHIRPVDSPQLKMHIVQPKTFGEAQTIADKYKADIPVIMNLTTSDAELSKRMIDFASGLTYGLGGGLQKVADKVFMLTPANYDVSAEDKRRLKDKGLFTLG